MDDILAKDVGVLGVGGLWGRDIELRLVLADGGARRVGSHLEGRGGARYQEEGGEEQRYPWRGHLVKVKTRRGKGSGAAWAGGLKK